MITNIELSPDAGCELNTYYNYIQAWVTSTEKIYGSGDGGIAAFVIMMKSKDGVNRLGVNIKINNTLRADYLRGQYTLLLMQKLPIMKHPELALSANMWLPVQSYYAVNGVGLALLLALGQRGDNHNHRAFRNSFGNILHSYFPLPFCACCKGGPDRSSFSFTHINTTATQVIEQHNLANPKYAIGDHFLGKSLSTTRTATLEEKYKDKRNSQRNSINQRSRLSKMEKKDIWERCSDTTVCDLLYRMRVKSNYKNPDMYLSAVSNVQDAANHYNNLLYLTRLIIAGLDVLITKKIGEPEMAKLKKTITLV